MTDIQMQGLLYIGVMVLPGGMNLFQIGKFKKGDKFPFLSVLSGAVYVVTLLWFFYCTTVGVFTNFYLLTTIAYIIASIAEFVELFMMGKKTLTGLITAMVSCIPWLGAVWLLAKV